MALGTTTKGTKSRLANMTPAQLNFLETFILSGKNVSDLTGKNVKKIDKAEKQKIKNYEVYAKKAKELNDEIAGTIDIDDGRSEVLEGLATARQHAETADLAKALDVLKSLGDFAKRAKSAKAKRENAKKELEQKQRRPAKQRPRLNRKPLRNAARKTRANTRSRCPSMPMH